MKRTTYWAWFAVLFLLVAGWALFRLLNSGDFAIYVETGFRDWFWQYRGLDLVVQVLLVFAGALGIAAILPMEDEDE